MLELVDSHVSSLFGEEGARHRWWLDKLGREGEEGWVLEEPVGACWSLLEPIEWFLNCVQMLVGKGQPVVGEEF